MFRRLLVVFAVLLLGVTAAAAQSCEDVIDKRQTLMKKSGAEAKMGTEMIKGERPFDLAKVQEIYAAFAEDAKQMPTLFPDCSRTGHKTTAAPAIWQKMDDFKAENRQVRRRHQSGAGQYQGPRWFEGEFPNPRQELQQLPPDLPHQNELTP